MKPTLLALLLIASVAPAIAITPANVQGTTTGPQVQGPLQVTAPKNAGSPAPSVQQTLQGSTASMAVKPPAVKPPPPSATDSKQHADDSSGMRRGVVNKVDLAKGHFHVFGQQVSFDPKQVKVIGANGKPTSIYAGRERALHARSRRPKAQTRSSHLRQLKWGTRR
jgi:hypothetical protein